jgi:hypothetical protein
MSMEPGALNSTERNQTMGHLGSTYEKYYTPTHIARDFQSIYFGSPSEDLLVQAVARMGLSRDRRAPTHLDEERKAALHKDPSMVALRQQRTQLKEELYAQGHSTLLEAQGTLLHEKYMRTNREIVSTYQRLLRESLKAVIRDFHSSVDTLEVARQLSGKSASHVLTLPAAEFELPERAAIASMIFKPFSGEKARIQYVWMLARLSQLQEARRSKPLKRVALNSADESEQSTFPSAEHQDSQRGPGLLMSPKRRRTGTVTQLSCEGRAPGEKQYSDVFPLLLDQPVCLICIGNKQFTDKRRLRHISRRDLLNKHLETHFRCKPYQQRFECRHPRCRDILEDKQHFKRHALEVHGVTY